MFIRTFLCIFFVFATLAVANAPVHNRAALGAPGGGSSGGGSRTTPSKNNKNNNNKNTNNKNNNNKNKNPNNNKNTNTHEESTGSKNKDTSNGSKSPSKKSKPNGSNINKKVIPVLVRVKDEDSDADSVFSLGSYKPNEGDEQELFEKFNERSEPFFSVMYDFFAAKPTYLETKTNPYAEASGSQNPWKDGYQKRPTGDPIKVTRTVNKSPVTASFNPKSSQHVCGAWSRLATYCEGGGADCACYSGTYYVPDQWNSLAAGCVDLVKDCSKATASSDKHWCEVASTAKSNTDFCSTQSLNMEDLSMYKFAEIANIASTPASQPDAKTTATSVVRIATSGSAETSRASASSTSSSPFLPSRSPISTAGNTSWSPRLLDPFTASMYSLLVVFAALVQ